MVRVQNNAKHPLTIHVKLANPPKGRRKSRWDRAALLDGRTTELDDKTWEAAKKLKPVQARIASGDLVELPALKEPAA